MDKGFSSNVLHAQQQLQSLQNCASSYLVLYFVPPGNDQYSSQTLLIKDIRADFFINGLCVQPGVFIMPRLETASLNPFANNTVNIVGDVIFMHPNFNNGVMNAQDDNKVKPEPNSTTNSSNGVIPVVATVVNTANNNNTNTNNNNTNNSNDNNINDEKENNNQNNNNLTPATMFRNLMYLGSPHYSQNNKNILAVQPPFASPKSTSTMTSTMAIPIASIVQTPSTMKNMTYIDTDTPVKRYIEKSKQNNKSTSHRGTSCHQCKNTKVPNKLSFCENLFHKRSRPEIRECKKKYCDTCLDKFYTLEEVKRKIDGRWICPSCRDACSCALCTRKKSPDDNKARSNTHTSDNINDDKNKDNDNIIKDNQNDNITPNTSSRSLKRKLQKRKISRSPEPDWANIIKSPIKRPYKNTQVSSTTNNNNNVSEEEINVLSSTAINNAIDVLGQLANS